MSTPTTALVLCGGRGTRLGEMTKNTPKALVLVAGMPIIDRVIMELGTHKLKVCLLTGHMREQIEANARGMWPGHVGEGDLTCHSDNPPGGTGTALLDACAREKSTVLVCNGDSLIDYNFMKFCDAHKNSHAAVTLLVSRGHLAGRGMVEFGENHQIINFKKATAGMGYFSTGVMLIEPEKLCEYTGQSFEEEILPKMIEDGRVFGVITQNEVHDMGTPEGLKEMETWLATSR